MTCSGLWPTPAGDAGRPSGRSTSPPPDHLATVSYDTTPAHPLDAGYEPWLISGARNFRHGHDWYGAFTAHGPTRFVTAVAARLDSPEPVPRTDAETLHPEAPLTNSAAPSPAPSDSRRTSAARSRTRATAGDSRPQPSATRAHKADQAATNRPRNRVVAGGHHGAVDDEDSVPVEPVLLPKCQQRSDVVNDAVCGRLGDPEQRRQPARGQVCAPVRRDQRDAILQ